MSTAAAAPAPSRLTPLRLLFAIIFAALGVVAVWQGFGLAGHGTDAQALRVGASAAALFVCGLILVWPGIKLPVRVLALLLGLGGAVAAWWFVPYRDKGWSLREAVAERDKVKSWVATPLLDNVQNAKSAKSSFDTLEQQYPALAADVRADYTRWIGTAEQTLAERYRQTSPDDLKTALELQALKNALGSRGIGSIETQLDLAARQWLSNALSAKTRELEKLPQNNWEEFSEGFNKTAAGRKALAEAFPETRETLLRAETDWVDAAVEVIVTNNLSPQPGEPPPARDFWLKTHSEVLALQSLDDSDRRFVKSRLRLFTVAHQTAQRDIIAHLAAGRYEAASNVARTHQVQWDATAALLGGNELAMLAKLRETCKYPADLAAKASSTETPEISPPPRPKSDKEPK